ncbi:MAG: class II glutamine amidotransferase, partial [Salinibacter sp.]
MCRLYGLQATHPTRSACELLDAQNAMIQQSREDARGLSNPHGWGMGQVTDGTTSCFRQVEPAAESESYREEALKTEGTTVLAHVRRATVGDPSHANTHPFRHGPALLIHNG